MHHFSSISNRSFTLNSTIFSDPSYGTQKFIIIVTKSHEVIPYFSHLKAYLFRLSFNIIITSTCRLRYILAPWSIHHEGENDKSKRHILPVLKYILILCPGYTFWTYERGFRCFCSVQNRYCWSYDLSKKAALPTAFATPAPPPECGPIIETLPRT
jgi:hypothetical protein